MLQKYDPAIQVLAKLPSVAETVEWFHQHQEPDLIFLDIHLEDDLSFAIFYANAGITFLVAPDKMEYPIDYSLDQLTERMDPKRFFRINRQFLVNHGAIRNVFVYPKSKLKVELYPPPQGEVFVSIDKVTKFKVWFGS